MPKFKRRAQLANVTDKVRDAVWKRLPLCPKAKTALHLPCLWCFGSDDVGLGC
jgi:hypothetical protein